MTVQNKISDYDLLTQALIKLAARCDGANSEDGVGFNKGDSYGGKYLAGRLSRGGELSPGEQLQALQMLQKYRKQLAGIGINLPEATKYQTRSMSNVGPATSMQPVAPAVIDAKNGELVISFPYNADTVSKIKTLPQRKFDPTLKRWIVPAGYLDQVTAILPEAQITAEAQALNKSVTTVTTAITPKVLACASNAVMIVSLDAGTLKLSFDYNPVLVEKVRSLPERKFNPVNKTWSVPARLAMEVVKLFPEAQLDPAVSEHIENMARLSDKANAQTSNFDVPLLTGALMPFQRAGVEFVEMSGGKCIIGDDMGLGKTVQSLAYLQLHPELRPAVIITPASVKINWQLEVSKFMIDAKQTHVISGQKPYKLDNADIFLLNYDLLHHWQNEIERLNPKVIIFDEAHRCKAGAKSKRGKAAIELSRKIPHRLYLTGTPILNRPQEFFPLLNMVDPDAWPNFFSFGRRYCGARQVSIGRGKTAWDFSGASNLAELHEKSKPFMIRRMKTEVLKDLPDKRRVIIPIKLTPDELIEYNTTLDEALTVMEEEDNQAIQLAMIEKSKQAAAKAKMPYVKEWIDDFLSGDQKIVIFGVHRDVTIGLYEQYKDQATSIVGGLSAQERQDAKDKFQEDPACKLISCNTQAAGEGVTLTAASNLAFIEYPWTPGLLKQCEDRIHRIGQKNAATIYQFVALDTIEEDITRLLNKKAMIIDKAIDGKETNEDENIFKELVKILKAH